MGLDRRHHRTAAVVGRTHFKAQTVSLALPHTKCRQGGMRFKHVYVV
jgi:hypothetical protein